MSRPRGPRRRHLAAAAVIALLLGGSAAWGQMPHDRLETISPGSLQVAGAAIGTASADGLRVSVTGGESPQVRVSTELGQVWSSPPGQAFIGAARGSVAAPEHQGYLWLHTDHERRWATQRLERVTAAGGAVVLTGELTDGAGRAGPTWRVELSATAEGAMMDARLGDEGQATSIGLWSAREASAGVHGFGEQFAGWDLDGRLLPIIVREQGVGRGEQPLTLLADVTSHGAGGTEAMTYAAWASWVTDDLHGVRLDPDLAASHALAVADTRDPERVGLEIYATHLRAELVTGTTPTELLTRQLAGASRPEPAYWTGQGAIVGIQGGTEAVRSTLDSLQQAGAEISGVWLQDWTGQRSTSFGQRLWWTWQLDRQRYPGWEALVADLAAQGITVTTYVNPFLVDPAGQAPPPERDLFAEAAAAGHLVTDAAGQPYALDQGGFDAYLVDLTDPVARHWYAQVIATEVLGQGVAGFMADFGEGLPLDADLAGGDALTAHNRWPSLWAQTVEEACQLAGQPDCVTWFRAGALGMDEHAQMFWNGDQLTSFGRQDGLASVLAGTFSAGVSGWPLVHSDVGGYTSIDAAVRDYVRSPELLARWEELAAFGVMMRTHEGNRPDRNTQVDSSEQTRADFARASRIFAALADYRAEVVATAQRTGVPALRHGWLAAPGTAAASVDTQLFFGPSILVAPVLTEGASEVEVTLPPGRWRHLLTGEVYEGDATHVVPAPVGTPAAFVETSDPWADRLTAALANL